MTKRYCSRLQGPGLKPRVTATAGARPRARARGSAAAWAMLFCLGTASLAHAQTTTPLFSGAPAVFTLPAVEAPTLFDDQIFLIDVPDGALSLNIDLLADLDSNTTDIDLYVRIDSAPAIENQQVVADYAGESFLANESIVITSASDPPLRGGRVFHRPRPRTRPACRPA